jgi:uncharacterized protein YndB with AHSA1/START domain
LSNTDDGEFFYAAVQREPCLPSFRSHCTLNPNPVNADPYVRQEIVIGAPAERVFEAWADPDRIAQWHVERQVGDPRRDDSIAWFVCNDDLGGDGERLAVVRVEANRRLVLTNVSGGPWHGTVLDVKLSAEGQGTRVEVMQSGFSETLATQAPVVGSGWACMLAILKEYLERYDGTLRRLVEARRNVTPDPVAVSAALASATAIQRWAGEAPARMLATTPHGAVVIFPQQQGVFTVMGVGAVIVWYTTWGGASIIAGRTKAEQLAERFATEVGSGTESPQ